MRAPWLYNGQGMAKASKQPEHLRATELVNPATLRKHPRNYREHPPDQLKHIAASIREHGFYRNVVVSRDGFILAGHGVVLAALQLKLEQIPAIKLPVDHEHPAALRVLAGDNEIGRLAEIDDRQLSEILRDIRESSEDPAALDGTGYDYEKLAALVLVTRPASEIPDMNTAAHWVGVPEYQNKPDPYRIIVACASEQVRDDFMAHLGATQEHVIQTLGKAKTIEWPLRKRPKTHPKIVVGEGGADE